MTIPTPSKFLTNEGENTLKRRLEAILPRTEAFDCIVGYFFVSGFFKIYPALETCEKIRILIGMDGEPGLSSMIQVGATATGTPSVAESKEAFSRMLKYEFQEAEEKVHVEQGILKFVDWIHSGKLQIKLHQEQNMHAKVYVFTPSNPIPNVEHGWVITGSSNFSRTGFEGNLEFNVLLGEVPDHDYALYRFNELWEKAVDVKEVHEAIIQTVETDSPYGNFTPYELYLKFLTEYFRDYLGDRSLLDLGMIPTGFKKLQYQEDAVFTALQMLKAYGGVFLSDVVGLGKTYMSALLALQLDGRSLVIAPPSTLNEESHGSWKRVFRDFGIPGSKCESIGMLEKILRDGVEEYKYVFVDESHRFKGDSTIRYDLLKRICQGKGVILVSATPFNNTPNDIYNQLCLFQAPRSSTIPGMRNLEAFFERLRKRVQGLHRVHDAADYVKAVKRNSREMRKRVLKYVMVRRTRKEILEFYRDDLKKQKVSFPKVEDPKPLFYQLNENESAVFQRTLERITRADSHYARYKPITADYYKGKVDQLVVQGQRNLATFMKILLVKRLESSFHAFGKTLERFIESHKAVLKAFDQGWVFTSKKHSHKVLQFMQDGDTDAIQELVEQEKVEQFPAKDFKPLFRQHVQSDLDMLLEIKSDWRSIRRDPKWKYFCEKLRTESLLKKQKLIIFTEYADTAHYLAERIRREVEKKTLLFTASSSSEARHRIITNFDANAVEQSKDFRILVTTDVLAEGVNLHQSKIIINYDLPWNPTRLIQRAGRVNRVGTKFKKIQIYNFFPTDEGNTQIALTEAARTKIQAFISLLGNDGRLLTGDENIESHGLFDRMGSRRWAEQEEDDVKSELRYLRQIQELKEKYPLLFKRIMALPKKARSTRNVGSLEISMPGQDENEDNHAVAIETPSLVTYFRKGRLDKFYVASQASDSIEIDFYQTAKILETDDQEERSDIDLETFYSMLDRNKSFFTHATNPNLFEDEVVAAPRSSGNEAYVLRCLRSRVVRTCPNYMKKDRKLINQVKEIVQQGRMGKAVVRKLKAALEKTTDPIDVLRIIRQIVPQEYLFAETRKPSVKQAEKPGEVILSSYLE
jgi:superfamily II DNA/RNA helicase